MPPVWWPLSAFPFAGETSSPTYLRGRSWNQGHTIWVKNNSDPDTTVVRLRGQNLASADRFDDIPGRGGRAATIHAGQPALADCALTTCRRTERRNARNTSDFNDVLRIGDRRAAMAVTGRAFCASRSHRLRSKSAGVWQARNHTGGRRSYKEAKGLE